MSFAIKVRWKNAKSMVAHSEHSVKDITRCFTQLECQLRVATSISQVLGTIIVHSNYVEGLDINYLKIQPLNPTLPLL